MLKEFELLIKSFVATCFVMENFQFLKYYCVILKKKLSLLSFKHLMFKIFVLQKNVPKLYIYKVLNLFLYRYIIN